VENPGRMVTLLFPQILPSLDGIARTATHCVKGCHIALINILRLFCEITGELINSHDKN